MHKVFSRRCLIYRDIGCFRIRQNSRVKLNIIDNNISNLTIIDFNKNYFLVVVNSFNREFTKDRLKDIFTQTGKYRCEMFIYSYSSDVPFFSSFIDNLNTI